MRRLLKLILLTLVLAPASISFAQTTTAKDLDKKIEKSTLKLRSLAAVWGATFLAEYNGEQNYHNLSKIRKELANHIDHEIATFRNQQQVGGSEAYVKTVLDFYTYEKNLVDNYFTPFEALNASSDNQVQICRSNLTEAARKEGDYAGALNTERKAYAAKNNFSIEPSMNRSEPRPIVKIPVGFKKSAPDKPESAEPLSKPEEDESVDDEGSDETTKKPAKGHKN